MVRFGHKCYEIFGLIRKSALAKTPLIGAFAHGDGVLLAQLALLGRFEEIPEYLFFPRRHSEQSMSMIGDYYKYNAWFNPQLERKITLPYWRIHYEFFRTIRMSTLNLDSKIKCYKCLITYIWKRRHLFIGNIKHQAWILFQQIIKKFQ